MFKTLLICSATALLAACSTTQRAAAPDNRAANVPCHEYATGSHLLSKEGKCSSSPVRSYSQEDVQRTGQTDVGDALRMLDPSITVHH
ncbi:MAG: hypothetical protein JSR66_24720 [Proteobacteria bacterium]|nr:hypothetical protein [Pseudomonadota bacterium]